MRYNQRNFSIYEWLIVIMIVSVIVVVAIGYYIQLINESRRLSFQALGHNFSIAVTMSHARWLIQKTNNKSQSIMVIDNVKVVFNPEGWPIDVESEDYLGTEVCWRLWKGLLQNSSQAVKSWRGLLQASAIVSTQNKLSLKGFSASLLSPGWCRYKLTSQDESYYFFDYISKNGKVVIGTSK